MEKHRRIRKFQVRLSLKELAKLEIAAQKANSSSVSAFVREAALRAADAMASARAERNYQFLPSSPRA